MFPLKWRDCGVVLQGEQNDLVQSFTSVVSPESDDFWRVWYSRHNYLGQYRFGYARGKLGEPFRETDMSISGTPHATGLHIIGIPKHWNLIQPVYIPLSGGKSRIYFWAHAREGICRYFAADSTDGINYYVGDTSHPCLYHPNDRAVTDTNLKHMKLTMYCHDGRAPLPDGESPAPLNLLSNDATNVYRLPDGSFEMFTVEVLPTDREAGLLRVIQRRTSTDGLNWSDGKIILRPDAEDPDDLQFYYLAVTHMPQGRIGMLGYYRTDTETVDLEFCFSRDGISWQRPFRGAWIERKPEEGCISGSHAMIARGKDFFLFLSVYNHLHNGKLVELGATEQKSKIIACSITAEELLKFCAMQPLTDL